ncbi:hypothetical protein SAMN05421753_10182 [Planctomicrobium piriforme]|uniref:Uncharacterized protein n=1 Tax=Planctomicrobium piriforme TaxID=1576369 RepID=A0A1I3AVZ1_9PLAN|nr:hypothetical protein SAMN05421753_10182 [Planctomicrobium piriforme]
MVTIQVDDETFAELRKQATERGLTVEDWLRESTLDSAALPDSASSASEELWRERLATFISIHRPTGVPMDDSRESIYD